MLIFFNTNPPSFAYYLDVLCGSHHSWTPSVPSSLLYPWLNLTNGRFVVPLLLSLFEQWGGCFGCTQASSADPNHIAPLALIA